MNVDIFLQPFQVVAYGWMATSIIIAAIIASAAVRIASDIILGRCGR